MANEGGIGTLTPEQVEEMAEGIKGAKETLDKSRVAMEESNTKVGTMLKEQEELKKHAADNAEAIAKTDENLKKLGERMHTIAEGYTDTLNLLRKQTKQLGNDGGDERSAYRMRGGKGAIFSCRQEALELGHFLMATMKLDTSAKEYARRWLQDHRADLQFLPNIPKSFVEHVANPILAKEDYDRIRQLHASPFGVEIQALTGGATPGSILVSPQFVSTMIRNVEEHGAFRRNALVWPMGSDTVHVPRRSSGLVITWEGESDTGTGTDPGFELLGMTAKKQMALHRFSSELAEDAALSLADIFMYEFALAIAADEDAHGFLGDGTSTYHGFVGVIGATGSGTDATAESTAVPHLVTGAAGNDLATEITAAKLREMTGKVHTWATDVKWYLHRTLLATLTGIETSGGGPVVQFSEGSVPQIMGYPVERVDKMPAASTVSASEVCLALGDLRKSWILGDRRKMNVETSEHFYFNTDSIAIRVTARIGFLMTQGNGMVQYKSGSA